MSIEIHYELVGAKAAAEALRGLPHELQRSVLLKGLREVAKPIQAQLSANAPRLTGELSKHIVIETVKATEGDTHALVIGPDPKRFYGLFSEFGTKHQPARPWMRPVIDENVQPATQLFGLFVWKALLTLAKKLAKGG